MLALRVNDPIPGKLGKNPAPGDYENFAKQYGLDQPFPVQYVKFVWKVVGSIIKYAATEIYSAANDSSRV